MFELIKQGMEKLKKMESASIEVDFYEEKRVYEYLRDSNEFKSLYLGYYMYLGENPFYVEIDDGYIRFYTQKSFDSYIEFLEEGIKEYKEIIKKRK